MEYRLFFEVKYDNIKVSKKLSDLCTDGLWGKGDRIFAEYDLTENVLYVKDLEGNELGKYIENNRMIVFKIQGIKAEKKKIYEEWKKWNTGIDNPPEDMLRIIYFPVKYKESLCACCKVGGHSCDQSGAVWYVINEIIVEEVLQNVDMKKIFLEYKILPKWINIEMGVFPIINVGSDRFMEYYNDGWGSPYVKENETYWHGIRLDLGKLAPYINIIGVDCGMCVINILNKDIFPNVARDNLTNAVRKKIKFAVEKATYQYIVGELTEDREMQMALQDYINMNYSVDNPFYAMD